MASKSKSRPNLKSNFNKDIESNKKDMKHLEANIVSDSKSDKLIDMYQISVKADKSRQDKILMPVVINKANIQMEFDPGAGASIISKKTFESSFSSITLRPPNIMLSSVFIESKRPIGYFQCSIAFGDKTADSVDLAVVDGNVESIIGGP